MKERFEAMCTMELRAYRDYYYEQLALVTDYDPTGRGTERLNQYLNTINMILAERRSNDRD